MNDLSDLLKEAKPLYFKRKKFKKRMQRTMLTCFIIFAVFIGGYGGYTIRSLSGDYIANSETSFTDSYFPLDDYGLITVAY